MSSKKSEKYYRIDIGNTAIALHLGQPVTIANSNAYKPRAIIRDLGAHLGNAQELVMDCSQLQGYDSFLIVVYSKLLDWCRANSIKFRVEGASSDTEEYIRLFAPPEELPEARPRKSFLYTWFSTIGDKVSVMVRDSIKFTEFLGELTIKLLNLLIRPSQMRWHDFPNHFTNSGVNAVPISVLIVFLIGVTSGYQGAIMLSQFGADIYIADVIGISIARELSPLMVAILVAGRSGAAFAAEIGTMKVAEEVDALNTMGFDHIKFLVLPRVVAVMLAMPILTLIADIGGIVGGLLMAITTLDITIAGYLNELQSALNYAHVFTGVGKSIIFGFLIATVGCFRGLQVTGGAESVGRYTTASVVSGILLIIVADALFTFVFQAIGI